MNQRNRIILNVLSNYIAFFVYGVCNFTLVWYAGKKIGAEAFGLVSLVLSLAMIANILIAGICQALTKHLAADFSNDNPENVNSLINSSLLWYTVCSVIGFSILFFLSRNLGRFFDIPENLLVTGRIAMTLMAVQILFVFPLTTFQGILWALQHYELTNLARIVSNLFRIAGVVVYFELVKPGIIEIVIITMLGLLIERIMWIVFSMKLLPQIRFGLHYVSKNAFKLLFGFGGFVFVIYVANLLGYEAVKWLIGSKLSMIDVGGYAVIATLAVFAGNLVRAIANVLMPAASHLDAQGRDEDIKRLALISTRYAMLLSTGLCILPLVLLEPFLNFWVGKIYTSDYIHSLAICGMVLLSGQWFVTIPLCLNQLMAGTGRVRVPAAITLMWAVSGLCIMWIALHYGKPVLLIAVAIITVARLLGSLAHLIYGLSVLKIKVFEFLSKALGLPALAGLGICVLLLAIRKVLNYSQVTGFLLATAIAVGTYAAVSWFWIMESNERASAVYRIHKLLGRKQKA